jgi:ABC-2 type transport system permease protein
MFKSLNPLFTIVRREIDWMRTKWIYWFLTVVGPLLGFALVTGIFHKGVIRDLPISVIDHDQSKTSRQVIRMIDASSIAKIISRPTDLESARELLYLGETQAIVVVPDNFEQELFKNNAPELLVYINNANILKGGLLKSGIFKTVSTFSAGVKIQYAMKKGENYNQALTNAMPISLDTHILFNPYTNYFYFLATALMPVILVVFVLLSAIYTLGYELKNHSSKAALEKAGNSIIVLVVGKMLPYTILFFIQALIMNYLIFGFMEMPMSGSYATLLISELLLILSYQAMGVFMLGIFGNLRLSVSLGSAYSMMALTFAGLTFPDFGMPLLARIFGQLFPLSHWLRVFTGQTLRAEPLSNSLIQLSLMFVFIAMGMVCLYWLKIKYSNEKYWGKN